MSEPAFPPHVAAALDRYTVKPLPKGFSERLTECAMTRNALAEPLPGAATRRTSPWRRAGRVVVSMGAIGFFAAAAAAGGIFGKPLYVPGITEVMEQAEIIERRPDPVAHAIRAKPTAIKSEQPVVAAPADTGQAKAKAAFTEMRKDPDFQTLRPRDKMKAVATEARTLVKSGEATKQEVRKALRETAKESYREMTPEQQAEVRRRLENWQDRRAEKRELRQQRLQQWRENRVDPPQ